VEHGYPSDESKTYRIPKRQRMFTAEGFYSAVGDSTEFYETNTGQYWKLAKEGLYDDLLVEYRKKKREKFEGIYLRGLAYSVKELDDKGNEIESIVFKRLISLDKASNDIASK
jgi:hypothetical protein